MRTEVYEKAKHEAPGVLGVNTVLEKMKGVPYRFMGASRTEKMFRLIDEEGNEYLFKVATGNRKIVSIDRCFYEDDEERPAWSERAEPLGTIIISDYNKLDNLFHGVAPTGNFTNVMGVAPSPTNDARWNKGYRFTDAQHGHPWLLIGIDNYKSPKPRPIFTYNDIGDEDEEDGE
jgi:hypothetical protein